MEPEKEKTFYEKYKHSQIKWNEKNREYLNEYYKKYKLKKRLEKIINENRELVEEILKKNKL